ncbi:hypothetical protein Runsl_2161 [Runella slithyformis DSM 19594]|uniref:Uncharacterized protein n=1 Tax=Runella slithyformis (strain ATCC 29530 / DSM 19594 / LMG 11500 / NCIMB 11436 / LSU 4) TaxID=761193 RepID=A0A7U3ZJV3_RUNSL|nr:hypothetical protein Runsl_2161 [Runella slithyformis DSM 19594]
MSNKEIKIKEEMYLIQMINPSDYVTFIHLFCSRWI